MRNRGEEVIGSIVKMEAREVGRDLAPRHNAPQGSPPLDISPRIEGGVPTFSVSE